MRTNYTKTSKASGCCFDQNQIRQKTIPFTRAWAACCLSLVFILPVASFGSTDPGSKFIGEKSVASPNTEGNASIDKFDEDLSALLMDIQVSGTVKDDNGDPLPGASVTVAGTT
ncbi:MAG: carboxypeptidase-like regulatory domain-containing protein, partial [Cyclobacteriaceae bacterium]